MRRRSALAAEMKLTVRAYNCLERAIGEPFHPYMRATEALELLSRRAEANGWSVRHLLLRAKGCGVVSANEIFQWCGQPMIGAAHACVCRDCGRRMMGA